MKRKPIAPWHVAFGTLPVEPCWSVQQVWEYLDGHYAKHRHACISIDGPHGTLSGYYPRDLWECFAEDAEALDGFCRMSARHQGE